MLPVWTKCLFCGWSPVAKLQFILGPMANQTLALSEEVTTIGSVAGNTVVLADPAVSRKHAGIRKVNGLYELADLGSTNGVYVNGHKVPKKTLEPGDIIRVGNTEAVFKPE
jgi:pSer/pThr/pTyr-binding forkhead associated (FHA) protein